MAHSHRIEEFRNFATLRASVPGLGNTPVDADIFCTLAWFENLAANGFDPTAKLKLLLVGGPSSTSAVCLPLVHSPKTKKLASLSNYYSSLFGPIGEALQVQRTDWEVILETVLSGPESISTIDLNPLDQDSAFFKEMIVALQRRGLWADTYFCFGNWYLKVAGRPYSAYLETLPSALRNSIKRGKKKLATAGEWQIDIYRENGPDLDRAIREFKTVYAQSWKQPEAYPFFIESLCRTAAQNGWLRLGILLLDHQPVAAQLWLVHGTRALIYKLAYVSAYSRLSPGTVLTATMMQHAIDHDRVAEVDYLTGDDDYKRDWMSHRRERIGIVAFNPKTLRGLVAAGRHYLPKWIKTGRRQ